MCPMPLINLSTGRRSQQRQRQQDVRQRAPLCRSIGCTPRFPHLSAPPHASIDPIAFGKPCLLIRPLAGTGTLRAAVLASGTRNVLEPIVSENARPMRVYPSKAGVFLFISFLSSRLRIRGLACQLSQPPLHLRWHQAGGLVLRKPRCFSRQVGSVSASWHSTDIGVHIRHPQKKKIKS